MFRLLILRARFCVCVAFVVSFAGVFALAQEQAPPAAEPAPSPTQPETQAPTPAPETPAPVPAPEPPAPTPAPETPAPAPEAPAPAPTAAPAPPLLPDSSFEEGKWSPFTWNGVAAIEIAESGRTGQRSGQIFSEAGADAAWTITAPVTPFSKYRLTGWIKTEKVAVSTGRGALLNLHDLQPAATQALVGTQDWTQVQVEFDTDDRDSIQINCLLGGWGLATGKAWYDDIQLELVSTMSVNPQITIDAAKTGAPISKYIYGQFIEHLGRCIYGGIWAEMVEDRKFFYPLDSPECPWKPVGEQNAIKMDDKAPLVNSYSPRLDLPGDVGLAGIEQRGLGLVKGKQYVGRVVLAGPLEVGVVEVRLVWDEQSSSHQSVTITNIVEQFTAFPIQFTAGADTSDGILQILGQGRGSFRIGAVSLMPADNVDGFRADTLALLRELNAPIYRWPGGNFVSGYNWRDGLGNRDMRPTKKNPAWMGIEPNDVGVHEFLHFCSLVNAEPYIAVNSGQGDAAGAAQLVQYVNGPADSEMGKLRGANGQAEPWGAKWWGVGNEMYGDWQLGHVPLEQYMARHNEFASAMRAADPNIKLVAVGATGPWTEGMLANCAGNMDLLSEHFYCQGLPSVLAHVTQLKKNIRAKTDAHRTYLATIPAVQGKVIPIAMDEWNYWYGDHVFGELGTRYFLQDALGVAEAIHEYARQSDIIFMANYAQTVNVIGAIKTNETQAAFETTGLALKLYRQHFGVIPVAVEGTTGVVDVMAAWTEDHTALTVGIVNPMAQAIDAPFTVVGATLSGAGTVYVITGTDPMAYNDPATPNTITIQEKEVAGITNTLSLPPLSVSLYVLKAQ